MAFERKWTVVQHSAAGYKSNPQFAAGLESMVVTNAAEARMVERVGGVLFATYGAAEEYATGEMYPEGYDGIVPEARGEFARDRIDGLKIYIPAINYRLTVTDSEGTVIDTVTLTRAELRRAQGTAIGALTLLQGLSLGTLPGEAQ